MRMRFPFCYGIASVTELSHLVVVLDAEIDGRLATGVAADGLAPKWFTKNPETTFEEDDLPQMLRVIARAAGTAVGLPAMATAFHWWQAMYSAQSEWAGAAGVPGLLAGFGLSLIERALLDAVCRSQGVTLHQAFTDEIVGGSPGDIRPAASGLRWRDILPAAPAARIAVRHTIGLGDRLTATDVAGDQPDDGLPFTLEENLQRYGLRFLKVKISGDFDRDHDRLLRIASLLDRAGHRSTRFTLDGNEAYQQLSAFRSHWERHLDDASLRSWFDEGLLFVEQPLHRDVALDSDVAEAVREWPDAPPMVIDESDADLDSLPRALELGYAGTSHKNCKGVFKGFANLASITVARQHGLPAVLSAEDLINVGPIALHQDLAVVACLGLTHVERNGHQYLRGLSMFPDTIQNVAASAHAELYHREFDYPSVNIRDGYIDLTSINSSPFGVAPELPVTDIPRWDIGPPDEAVTGCR